MSLSIKKLTPAQIAASKPGIRCVDCGKVIKQPNRRWLQREVSQLEPLGLLIHTECADKRIAAAALAAVAAAPAVAEEAEGGDEAPDEIAIAAADAGAGEIAAAPAREEIGPVRGGIRGVVSRIAEGIRRHPYVTAAAAVALAGVAIWASRESFQTLCFKDSNDTNRAWCAELPTAADPTQALYEQFVAVKDWVHSGDLIQRNYQDVSGGIKFVYGTFTKYFVRNPFANFFR